MKTSQEFTVFDGRQKWTSSSWQDQNVSFDLKYVFCAGECSCMLHPLESVESKELNYVLVGRAVCANPT